MLKISLLFKKFTNFTRNNSIIIRIKNAKFSDYCFYMNTNIYGNFQICISVPLRNIYCTFKKNYLHIKKTEILIIIKIKGNIKDNFPLHTLFYCHQIVFLYLTCYN